MEKKTEHRSWKDPISVYLQGVNQGANQEALHTLEKEQFTIKTDMRYVRDAMVHKTDFIEFEKENKTEFSEVRAEIAEFRKETKAEFAEIRAELAEFKKETRAEFAEIRAELAEFKKETRAEFTEIRAESAKLAAELYMLKVEVVAIKEHIHNNLATKAELAEMKSSLQNLLITILVAIVGATAALWFKL